MYIHVHRRVSIPRPFQSPASWVPEGCTLHLGFVLSTILLCIRNAHDPSGTSHVASVEREGEKNQQTTKAQSTKHTRTSHLPRNAHVRPESGTTPLNKTLVCAAGYNVLLIQAPVFVRPRLAAHACLRNRAKIMEPSRARAEHPHAYLHAHAGARPRPACWISSHPRRPSRQ